MVRRKLLASLIGTGLLLSGALIAPGCSNDPGQPARESISAPRKGGGVTDAGTADKGAKKAGGKVGKGLD